MKFSMLEHDATFDIQMQAETLEDAATLTRMGLNVTKEPVDLTVTAFKGGQFSARLSFTKRKNASGRIRS
jgi:hypothetical protein